MPQRFYLERSGKDAYLPRHIHLDEFPGTVGRRSECGVRLAVARLSRMHARFDLDGRVLWVRDLGSTNGTFVNHQRVVEPTALQVGDVLHLADHEFRVMVDSIGREASGAGRTGEETVVGMTSLPQDFSLQMPAFFQLLAGEQVTGYGQPIVTAAGEPCAVELLGRSEHPDLEDGPAQLFALAATLDAEMRLSRMLRRRCFEQADRAGLRMPLFFNNHPAECEDMGGLLEEIQRLRRAYPDLSLVFEVHESVVTDLGAMAE